jgi:hypothetical protein
MSIIASGLIRTVDYINRDPVKATTIFNTSASLALKPPFILLDDETPSETKKHAALWEATDRTIALLSQLLIFPLLPVAGTILAKKAFKLTNPAAVNGAKHFTEFVFGTILLNTALVPYYNSKHLTSIINTISEKMTGKKYMPEQEEKEKENKEEFYKKIHQFFNNNPVKNVLTEEIPISTSSFKDKTNNILKILITPYTYPRDLLAGFLSGKQNNKNSNETNDLATTLKKVINISIGLAIGALMLKKAGPAIGKKLENFFVKESNVSFNKNIARILFAEAIIKPMLILMNGDPYMAMRKFMDKILGVGMLYASNPLIKKLTNVIANKYNMNQLSKNRLSTALTAGIQVALILNIALTLINNKITGRLFKHFNKEKEEEYENGYKYKLPTLSLTDNNFRESRFGAHSNQYKNQNPFQDFEARISTTGIII